MDAPLYLDHAATTPPLPEAMEAFERACREAYANPSSLHAAGAEAARTLERSRRTLRQALGARDYRVIWTGTGTESNHLAIQGYARRFGKRVARQAGVERARVLVGAIEHPSVLEAARALESEGLHLEEIPADDRGVIRVEALSPRLGEDVAVVSLQWAHNELGSVHPIPDLVRATRSLAPQARFHVDAMQAAGKLNLPMDMLGADAIAIAAHKVGGVRGCAALLLREGSPEPQPLFTGGGHEGGLRSGTENVAGAAAFAAAVRQRRAKLDQDPEGYRSRRQRLIAALRKVRSDILVLGPEDPAEVLGSILSFAVPGEKAEPLLHQLEAHGLYAGAGSACKAHGGPATSPTLTSIGLDPEWHDCVLRFSIDGSEDEETIERAAAIFARALEATSSSHRQARRISQNARR